MSATQFRRRVPLFYGCLFLGAGVQLPFLPLWLAAKGVDAHGIATILGAQIALRAVGSPLGAYLADRLGRRREVMIACAFMGFLCYLALPFASGFGAILAVIALGAIFNSAVVPLGEAYAVDGSARLGLDYGSLRLWGSVSFVAGSLISGGILELAPVLWAAPLMATGFGLLALACLGLPPEPPPSHGAHGPGGAGLGVLFTMPFLLFLTAASLGQASHALLQTFGAIHFDRIGYSKGGIGILWAVAVTAEVVLFAFSKRILAVTGYLGLIIAGVAGGLIRWPVTAFDPPFAVQLAAQALHALTFGALYIGSMLFIHDRISGPQRNTAQGVYAAVSSGLVMSLATWASAPIYDAAGAWGYWIMAAMSALALAAALRLKRLDRGA